MEICGAAEFRSASFSLFVMVLADRLMKRLSEISAVHEVLGSMRACMSCAVVRATSVFVRLKDKVVKWLWVLDSLVIIDCYRVTFFPKKFYIRIFLICLFSLFFLFLLCLFIH